MRSFRNLAVLSGAVTLAACGGDTRPQTVGSSAAVPSGTPTPTHSFVNPTEAKTYDAIGAVQHYDYYADSDKTGQGGQLYAGDANTARDSGVSLTYNPRDAIFELTINRPNGLVNVTAFRFQDPAHRTAFGGPSHPQAGVPEFAASRQIQYLEAGTMTGNTLPAGSPYRPGSTSSEYAVMDDASSSTRQTLFYQKPGTTTKYVTYAGFVRNTISGAVQTTSAGTTFLRETYNFDRAAFVFGERTANSAVPASGTASYSGEMIASMVVNVDPTTTADATNSSYIQWMQGSQTSTVNFSSKLVSMSLSGTLFAPTIDAYTSTLYPLSAGTAFSATGSATIDMAGRGGFAGSFSQACFAGSCTTGNALNIAGSSLDGTFYGPNGEEIGGGFRIVGGTPDQRIDILGAFTGKKP